MEGSSVGIALAFWRFGVSKGLRTLSLCSSFRISCVCYCTALYYSYTYDTMSINDSVDTDISLTDRMNMNNGPKSYWVYHRCRFLGYLNADLSQKTVNPTLLQWDIEVLTGEPKLEERRNALSPIITGASILFLRNCRELRLSNKSDLDVRVSWNCYTYAPKNELAITKVRKEMSVVYVPAVEEHLPLAKTFSNPMNRLVCSVTG